MNRIMKKIFTLIGALFLLKLLELLLLLTLHYVANTDVLCLVMYHFYTDILLILVLKVKM